MNTKPQIYYNNKHASTPQLIFFLNLFDLDYFDLLRHMDEHYFCCSLLIMNCENKCIILVLILFNCCS